MGTKQPWEDTATTLTEFAPLSSEVKPTRNFLSRLWKRDGSEQSTSSSATASETSSRETSVERSEKRKDGELSIAINIDPPIGSTSNKNVKDMLSDAARESDVESESGDNASQSGSQSGDTDGQGSVSSRRSRYVPKRTLSNVLSRLSNIIDRSANSSTPTTYKDSDFKQYWMPDSSCRECYDCGDKFTTFRRRHHCRVCGQIFCSKCCNQELPGKAIGYKGGIRVCTYCCRVVLKFAQSSGSEYEKAQQDDSSMSPNEFEYGASSSDFSIWSPLSKRASIIPDDAQQSVSNLDATSVTGFKALPFDLTPQSEFSISDSLLNERKMLSRDSVQLREIWRQIQDPLTGVDMQSHRIRLRTYQKCVVGKELVDWLLTNDKAAKREQGIAIGQALLHADYLAALSTQYNIFKDDFTLYKPGELSTLIEMEYETEDVNNSVLEKNSTEPSWLKEIESYGGDIDDLSMSEDMRSDSDRTKSQSETSSRHMFYLGDPSDSGSFSGDLLKLSSTPRDPNEEPVPRQDSSSAGLTEEFLKGTLLTESVTLSSDVISCPHGWRVVDELREENGEKLAYDRLRVCHTEHWNSLAKQLLSQRGLSFSWEPIILTYATKVSHFVRPDIIHEGDNPDIRQYLHVKKIPGGHKNETCLIHGLVFTKNIAHKKMKNRILNPQIMLLRGSIEYQRVENKLSSLEPQILQEREFLRNSVSKITKFYPNVLVVEKTVSRLAQDFLLDAGITLIFNVKPKVMERLARFTQADIVPSIDSLVGLPQLGVCHNFRSQAYTLPSGESKTVIVFDGCATHLGCTVLLRGSLVTELQKVKEIVQFMSYCSYNSLLEISYCMDEFALLPEEKDIDIEHDAHKHSDHLTVPRHSESGSSLETMNAEHPSQTTTAVSVTTDSESNSSALKNMPLSLKSVGSEKPTKSDDSKENKLPASSVKTDQDKSKPEIKRQHSAALVELTDESDPLKRYQKSQDDSIFQSRLLLKEQKHSSHMKFKQILHDTILSVSPYHKYEVPYLESDVGMKCLSRKFLPEEIYWSNLFEENSSRRTRSKGHEGDMNGVIANNKRNLQMADPHPFITCKMTAPLSDQSTQAMLADFRARGGRVKVTNKSDLWVNHTTTKKDSDQVKNSISSNDRIDCLDPVNHQKISVLFSSFSPKSFNFPNHCVLPWVVTMEFYGNNDISLGAFLQRFCFRESYMCPSSTCDTSILDHVRRFSHGKGCINIILKRLETEIPGGQNNILMWSWCRKCKQVTPVVPISADTWSLSFAKFLELRFYGNQFLRRASAEECPHSLHYEHNQYFGHQDILVSFKYTEMALKELALPSIVIDIKIPKLNANIMKDQVLLITNRSMERYSEILECTLHIKSEIQSESSARALSEFVTEQQSEKSQLRELATKIQEKIEEISNKEKTTSPLKEVIEGPNMTLSEIHDDIIRLKRLTTEAVVRWNTKIQEYLNHQQKKQSRPPSVTRKDKESLDEADRHSPRLPSSTHSSGESNQPAIPTVSSLVHHSETGGPPETVFQFEAPMSKGETGSGNIEKHLPTEKNSSNLLEKSIVPAEKSNVPTEKFGEKKDLSKEKTQVLNVPIEKPKAQGVEKLLTATDKLQVPTDKTSQASHKSSDKLTIPDADDATDGRSGDRRAAVKRALMFWQGPAFQPLALPYDASEHYLLPPCERVPVVVYDNEPSSIIAYALSSSDYNNKLKEVQNSLRLSKEGDLNGTSSKVADGLNTTDLQGKRTAGGVLSFFRVANTIPKDVNIVAHPGVSLDSVRYNPQLDSDSLEVDTDSDSASTLPGTINSENITKPTVKQSLGPHIEIQFSDNLARFYCRIYFAEQFRKLRKVIFPSGEDVFIRSLSRCKLWEAKGGKSGSTFCKTDDDRFILKQMSGMEVESFEKFGPQYFTYVTTTAIEKRPITLAQIVGVFRIGFRNTQTNSANKQDLLVVENLFYNRKISQKFDLKGSMRNRLVNTSGKREEELVLLDENLLKLSVDTPLYIRPHSKTVLKTAITSDSQFLSNNLVMDYSLIVGLDEINQELVVGIIDYIRTFTWDKKLEMVFKSSGLMGGHGKMPTVVSPQLYRSRFLEAMERYFLHVPDQWSGLGKDFPSPSENNTETEEEKK